MARRGGHEPLSPLPSRDDVLRFIAEYPGDANKRDIARAFNVKGDDRRALKNLLRDLEDEGVLNRTRGRRFHHAEQLPEITVVEITELDEDGTLRAKPVTAHDREAQADAVIVIPHEASPGKAAKVGDRVLAQLKPDADKLYFGRIIRVLPKNTKRLVGTLQAFGGQFAIRPAERNAKQDFAVAQDELSGAEPGDVVLAEPLGGQRYGQPRAKVAEVIGREDSPRTISLVAAYQNNIRLSFPQSALDQAEAAGPAELGQRTDLRTVPLVTIDGADARDFDDAVFAEPDDDPSNPGGWRLIVAIADVAHYVRSDDALDREAQLRGNSTYFPDRVIPMLPEALSNGWCSLRPDEARACLAVRMTIDADGHKKSHRFVRGLMRSKARLTYEQVQAAHDGQADALTTPLLDSAIRPLYGAYRALLRARAKRGTMELDLPELKVDLAEDGRVLGISPRARLDAHKLIEEFMIAANVAAAESLGRHDMPFLYRAHDKPDPQKLESLREFMASLGLPLSGQSLGRPEDFNRLLARLEEDSVRRMVSQLILRAQAQAVYQPDNIGHYGLQLRHYAHFTSPIRRYADLVVHRALIRTLKLPGEGGALETDPERMAKIGEQISITERQSMAAERQAQERYVALYLQNRVGARFAGTITSVQRFGLFVQITEVGADGFVPAAELGNDYYAFDAAAQTLVGERYGDTYAVGDTVAVELLEAQPIQGGLKLKIVEHKSGALGRMRQRQGATSGRRGGSTFKRGPRKNVGKSRKVNKRGKR